MYVYSIHIGPTLCIYVYIYVKAKRYTEMSYFMLSIGTGMEWSPFIESDPKPAEWALG